MPSTLKSWLKPHSNSCPCCLLVLNQENCAFPNGINDYLLHNGTESKDIPKNLVLSHHQAGPEIFNEDTLPASVSTHRLTAILRTYDRLRPLQNREFLTLTTARGSCKAKSRILDPELQTFRVCTLLTLEANCLEDKANKMNKKLSQSRMSLEHLQNSLWKTKFPKILAYSTPTFVDSILYNIEKSIKGDFVTLGTPELFEPEDFENDLSTTVSVMRNVIDSALRTYCAARQISYLLQLDQESERPHYLDTIEESNTARHLTSGETLPTRNDDDSWIQPEPRRHNETRLVSNTNLPEVVSPAEQEDRNEANASNQLSSRIVDYSVNNTPHSDSEDVPQRIHSTHRIRTGPKSPPPNYRLRDPLKSTSSIHVANDSEATEPLVTRDSRKLKLPERRSRMR